MGYGYILKNVLSKVLMSIIICGIVGFIGYNFAPIDKSLVTLLILLLGIGNSFIGIDALKAAKSEDNFIGNQSPFVAAMILTALNVLVFIVLVTYLFPIIFGDSFILPYEYYGISTNIWIGAFAILSIVWNSYMDLKYY